MQLERGGVEALAVVGRDAELARARRFLDSLALEPGAFLIEGEAGIGKTTVWASLIAEAESLKDAPMGEAIVAALPATSAGFDPACGSVETAKAKGTARPT